MFWKKIEHPIIQDLERGFLGFTGKINLLSFRHINIDISGRSEKYLRFAEDRIYELMEDLPRYMDEVREEIYEAYEIMKEVVESGEIDLEGNDFPTISDPSEIWKYVKLEEIYIRPKEEYPIRLGFQMIWDVEHDFGMLISQRIVQHSGVSI